MSDVWKVTLAVCALAISLTVIGCGGGGGGHKPKPIPPDTVCGPEQGQCSACEHKTCLGCNDGYKLANASNVPGGICVAKCIGQPPPGKPAKPGTPFDLNGKEWPTMCLNDSKSHFFGIGDWGGDGPDPGRTWTNPGRCVGGNVYPRYAMLANVTLASRPCTDADHWAQKYVARNMRMVAQNNPPQYILNVGDNFYPGGLDIDCGDAFDLGTSDQWSTQFDQVYTAELRGVPWYSALGNHDYGGMSFLAGWDSQIFTTWTRDDWVMPGQFWTTKIQYKDFAVQLFFLESNTQDARDGIDAGHQICQCGTKVGSKPCKDCFGINIGNCKDKFKEWWEGSKKMLEDGLKKSTAEWHIIVTHYPGESITVDPDIQKLHQQYGIDLIFTGHRHWQITGTDHDMFYIVSGGGGGITTDGAQAPDGNDDAYGFVDFEIDRITLTVNMHSWGGPDPGKIIIRKTVPLTSHKAKKAKQATVLQATHADITV